MCVSMRGLTYGFLAPGGRIDVYNNTFCLDISTVYEKDEEAAAVRVPFLFEFTLSIFLVTCEIFVRNAIS